MPETQALFPHGGTADGVRPSDAGGCISPFVRDANAAIIQLLSAAEHLDDANTLDGPADAYTSLGGLELLANRERRFLLRLARALGQLREDDRVVMDPDASPRNPAHAVGDALRAIETAVRLLTLLEAALDTARQPLASAGLRRTSTIELHGASR